MTTSSLSSFLAAFAHVGLSLQAVALDAVPLVAPRAWESLEFRVTGVPDGGNPFDPDSRRVDATFRLPSGETLAVPAFWYREHARRLEGRKEVLDATASPEWRLRFLPTTPGPHAIILTVLTNSQLAGEAVTHAFDVADNPHPPARLGQVRLARNRRYFETADGQPLPLVGANVCWHGARGTFDYDDWFEALAQAGGNFARLWMAPWAFGIETEAGARLNYRLDRAWQLDHVLRLAKRHGIYLLLCLDYHGMFETRPDFWGANDNWKIHPYNAANGGPCATQNEFFTHPEARGLYQKRLRYLIARYGYNAHLLAWQFFNEIDNVYRYLRPPDVATWHADLGDWLKAHDPWRHLVTTSLTGSSDRPEIWRLPQMDFAMYHSYAQADPAAVLPRIAHRFLEAYGKPMMIGEFGTDWRGWRREQDPYLRGWRQGVWAGALAGSVGTSMSWWWESIHADRLYPMFTALRSILEPAGWGTGEWQPIRFTTTGEPPATLGQPQPNAAPFSVTLPLGTGWGEKPGGRLAVADPDASGRSARTLNAFVHGTAHAALRSPFQVEVWATNGARLVMHLNSVSRGAVLAVLVDGQPIYERNLPDKDGRTTTSNEYNEDLAVDLPAGRRLVEIRNTGSDWFHLDWVRFENLLRAGYADGWRPSPISVGLRRDATALLYVVNPRASYPANATNAVVEPWRAGDVQLSGMPAGRYQALWLEPKSGDRLGGTSATSDGNVLVLPLPDFTEDLAGRLEAEADPVLHDEDRRNTGTP